MADPTDPTDWEKVNRGKAQDAYTRAGQAAEPLEGKTREPPPEKTAVQVHGMRQTMEPAALRKLDAESHIGRDKANADARLPREMIRRAGCVGARSDACEPGAGRRDDRRGPQMVGAHDRLPSLLDRDDVPLPPVRAPHRAEEAPGLIESLADLDEAEDYAEGRVRELTHLLRIMTARAREEGYDDVCREKLRLYRRLRMARRSQDLRPLRA